MLKLFVDALQKENIKTIPNFLTALRIMLSPLLGVLVVCQHFEHALGIFVMAGISDLVCFFHLFDYYY